MANPPNVYEFLFPQGDSLCAVSDSGRFLKDKDDRELAKSCLVRKVSHFKEDNGVHHELVLIDVFSSVNPNRTTFLESERCGGEVPQRQNSSPSPSGSSASISTLSNKSSKGLNADDKIFIPGIKIRENETFDKRSKILCTTNTLLYTVTLSKPCSIAQLLVMLNVLHNSSPNYTLLEKQCYWFAGTLCEMLRVKFEGKVSDNADERKAGKYKFIPVTRPSVQPEVLVKYDEAWKEFCDREDQEQQVSTLEWVVICVNPLFMSTSRISQRSRKSVSER
jgi:hypothetical protein